MSSKKPTLKADTKYNLKFVPDAWREWQALDGSIKQLLKPLLAKPQCTGVAFTPRGLGKAATQRHP